MLFISDVCFLVKAWYSARPAHMKRTSRVLVGRVLSECSGPYVKNDELGSGKGHLAPLNTASVKIFFFFIGTFKLTVEFTEEYPNKPPTVRFTSKMFHPNGKNPNLLLTFRRQFVFRLSFKEKKQAFVSTTNHALLLSFQFTQMEAYVSIFCKIAGVRLTTFHQFSPQSR